MISEGTFKGARAITLENDVLRAVILPQIGGKLSSIFRKNKEFELLFQNQKPVYRKARIHDSFGDYDASGFDDAFPSINIGHVIIDGKEVVYPDHGEIWSMEFNDSIENDKVILVGSSSFLPYKYKKIISLSEDSVLVEYSVTNFGSADIPCIWAAHYLVNCEPDMRIVFPEGTKEVENVVESRYLGNIGRIHPYPHTIAETGEKFDLDRVLPASACNWEKYYVNGKVKQGLCGIDYPSRDVKYRLYFDQEKLPYLGFWITEGKFRGDYNCALEPTNGYYDRIDTARSKNALYLLKKGDTFQFDLKIELK